LLDRRAIRTRLEAMAGGSRDRMAAGATEGREALLALIADDGQGARRLDVIADPTAPGGYRIEGMLRLPV
jgi:hypothetical protein